MSGMTEEAVGDEFKLTPTLAIKEEYDDNIFYSSTDTQKDFITTISPGLLLKNKTERMDISLSGRLEHRFYSSHKDFNATDQYYEGIGKYALTPRLNLSGKALFSLDSRPDRDIETTGLMLTSVKRDRQNYTISGDYQLSEKTITTFRYDYLKDRYENILFTDLKSNTINLGFILDISKILKSTKVRVHTGYAKYNTSSMEIDNFEARAGIDCALNEKWNLLLDGGGRYTNSKFKISELMGISKKEKNHGWGTIGQLALIYEGERYSGKISASMDILPASGYSGTTERTSFIFSVSRRFNNELYGTLQGGYYINKSRAGEFSTHEIDESTIRLTPGIRYQIDNDKTIEFIYAYNMKKYNISGNRAHKNVFFISYRIQHHLFE